jgi:hypothetical protein
MKLIDLEFEELMISEAISLPLKSLDLVVSSLQWSF